MIFTFFLFFIDFISFAFLNAWIINSLSIYFILTIFTNPSKGLNLKFIVLTLFLIVQQDLFLNGRFGLCLLYYLPFVFIFYRLQTLVNFPLLFYPFSWALVVSTDFALKKLIYLQNISLNSTFYKFFINLIIGYLILLGMRGNRPIFKMIRIGRKVRTPSRKNAS